jgi:hypothetical protein
MSFSPEMAQSGRRAKPETEKLHYPLHAMLKTKALS